MATIDRPKNLALITEAERAARRLRAEHCKAVIEAKVAAGEPVLFSDGLGLWGGEPVDGMVYQDWIRSE